MCVCVSIRIGLRIPHFNLEHRSRGGRLGQGCGSPKPQTLRERNGQTHSVQAAMGAVNGRYGGRQWPGTVSGASRHQFQLQGKKALHPRACKTASTYVKVKVVLGVPHLAHLDIATLGPCAPRTSQEGHANATVAWQASKCNTVGIISTSASTPPGRLGR